MNGFISLFLLQMFVAKFTYVNLSNNGGLKWVRVHIPQYKVPGEVAQLQCDYDLGNTSLYAVKWYKDHEEFYRFVPRRRPAATSFKVEGVFVDMNISDSKRVILRSVSLNTTGLFRCEVSAEAPSFASAQSEARMEVVYLPKEDPYISGVEMQYQIGDEIDLNCTSGMSYPPSTLYWYINDKQVVSHDQLIDYQLVEHRHGLVSSILGLRFVLTGRHFLDGLMRVKCVATVWPALWQGEQENALQSLPSREMREALLFVKSSATNQRSFTSILFIVTLNYLTV